MLATQTLVQKKANNFRINVNGELPLGVTSKDVILQIIGKIGTAGGTGCVVEYAGDLIRSLTVEQRMTICNMTIEGCLLYTSPSPRDATLSRMPSSA